MMVIGSVRKILLENSDVQIQIPGSGAMESLNVSVATGIILAEHWRQHGPIGTDSGES